jgi:hypothetical protein
MKPVARWTPALLLALALAACQDGSTLPIVSEPDPPAPPAAPTPAPPIGDPLAGLAAFTNVCAACHTSRDGFDLAFFGFSDTTITRRAAPHVDAQTALNIVAHVRTLSVIPSTRDRRIFQPGGVVLSSDVDFALGLFGGDGWPASLTTEQLRAIDPLNVAVAVPLPLWSIEFSNLDWMPEAPPPDQLLDFRGSAARTAITRYYGAPTTTNLVAAVAALRNAERNAENSAAPCITEPREAFQTVPCFEVRRWTSSLVAQHMLRNGLDEAVQPVLHDVWWDVGNAARLAPMGALENKELNWASWMYLGWSFEPDRHASTYLGNGLSRLGLNRHATFVALRAAVGRPPASAAPYADVATAARLAPVGWTLDAVSFGYRHLLERLQSGEMLREAEKAEASTHIHNAYTAAVRKLSPQEGVALAERRDAVLTALQ